VVAAGTFTAAFRITDSRNLLKQDGIAYFLYARSIVVDFDTDVTGDADVAWRRFNSSTTRTLSDWGTRIPSTGAYVLPWPIGMGVVMAPFYALGWAVEIVVARVLGRAPDSYGVIPQVFFASGSLFYGLVGFWLTVACCRAVMRRGVAARDTEWTGELATLTVSLGGPLVFYVFFYPTMAHAPSFAYVALYTWVWLRAWERGTDRRGAFLLGGLLGLVTIVRYQSAMFGVMLMGLAIREGRRKSPRDAFGVVAAGLLGLSIPVAIQVAHLLIVLGPALASGEASLWSTAKNPLDLASPGFLEVLFGCQHGAFHGSPAMGVAFFALAVSAWKEGWARVLAATFLAHVFLIGSLEDQANRLPGGAPGMRYLTECTTLLSIGLAAALHRVPSRRRRWVWPALWLLVLWYLGVVAAFALRTIPQDGCVTWMDMARGIIASLKRVVGGT
jgi:hypothetical protein